MSLTASLSADPAAPVQPSLVVDVTLSTFAAEVLQASQKQLVIVDFWAPWCEPCKQLGPVLEKAILALGGVAKLAKVNIDENPQIAQEMRVQSVPTVFAFFKGQPLDGFMGAQPESQIKQWLVELIKATGIKASSGATEDMSKALAQAEELLASGDVETSKAIYADIYAEQPELVPAFAGLLRCMIAQGQADEAARLLAQAPDAAAQDKAMEPVKAALEVAMQAQKAGGVSLQELKTKCEAEPENHQARFDYALQAFANGEAETAIDELLVIVGKDRKWADDGARKQLVQFFEALGQTHPQTIEGRKKLSSVLFS